MEYRINGDNSFTILDGGSEIYTSRQFRLVTQAIGKAKEYIDNATGKQPDGDITLDVQNFSIDPDTFFRR